jgi:hypothetical protein
VPGRYFRAAAVDFDGTLTGSDRPSPDVLAAIADTRADGRRVELRACQDEVISHHCGLADLSRWIGEVLGDPPLAADVAQIEKGMRAGTTSVAQARTRLIDVIHRRYGE